MPGILELPAPRFEGDVSVEQTLKRRRSIRNFIDEGLTLDQTGQILWAAQGMSDSNGYRTSPSAGALYPLEIYVVAGNVFDFPAGVYRYLPAKHALLRISPGDKRPLLAGSALGQPSIRQAPLVLVFCAVYGRMTGTYGQRGVMYVHMEAGHAAQNVFLQAVALGLATVPVGAFLDEEVKVLLNNDIEEQPIYILPIGKPL